jgi:hypothetical protein
MQKHEDTKLWRHAYLDTPFGIPRGLTREQAFHTPGCRVKSRERKRSPVGIIGWPIHFGVLVKTKDTPWSADSPLEAFDVVVRSTEREDITVWTGTVAEYEAMWECD